MKNIPKEMNSVKFGRPDPVDHTVLVSRVLPDGTESPIGKIQPDISAGEDALLYISKGMNEEELFPPTADFAEVERLYCRYAKQLSERSFMEGILSEHEKTEQRMRTMNGIRGIKVKECRQINK
jgi:hypothetical protein